MATLTSQNPSTGEIIQHFKPLNKDTIEQQLQLASAAQKQWQQQSLSSRAYVLNQIAAQLREQQEPLAQCIANEMGKPLKEGGAEVNKAAYCCEYYATHAAEFLQPDELPSDATRSYVLYQPLGVILGILPWNFPIWLAARFFAPALMAGNTCILKHDPHVMGCAKLLGDIFTHIKAPNLLINLPIEVQSVPSVIAHPSIAAISFTGSTHAGVNVASLAALAIKPCVLELGGSDPFIVLSDAHLDDAANAAVISRTSNAGQSCIAAKRIIVIHDIYDTFIEKLKTKLSALKVGNPMDESTDVGPLARADLRDNLDRQVSDSIAAGAKCLLGGKPLAGKGFYYPVTLLTDVTEDMAVFKEETFGPVAVVIKAQSVEHAVNLANNTDYGLGAGVWTCDIKLAEKIALQINAGQVAINGIVKTDPRLPSGGIKRSGYGRELGPHGIKEFVNAKQIWLA